MSQVVDAIVATDTRERKVIQDGRSALLTDIFQSKSEWIEIKDPSVVAKIYKIGVLIGAQTMVTDIQYESSTNSLSEAVKRTKRQVIEGIYGEFRPHFRQIEIAIYNHNMEEAGRLLYEMEKSMFGDFR